MPYHQVTIEQEGAAPVTFRCSDRSTVLSGLSGRGMNTIKVGCRGGGCGVCRVLLVSGEVECLTMSRAHIGAKEQQARQVLACRIKPKSDLVVRLLEPATAGARQPAAR